MTRSHLPFGWLLFRISEISPGEGVIVHEGEDQTVNVDSGLVVAQPMKNFCGDWAGGKQLWWGGAEPSSKLVANIDVPPGRYRVALHLTKARDYGKVEITGTALTPKSSDLYAPNVSLADPLVWDNVEIKEAMDFEIIINIAGANPLADPKWMVGIDRIEFAPVTVVKPAAGLQR